MSAPKRIQRRRTTGWRMPEGAVYVGRPSQWGNPHPVDRKCSDCGGFGNVPVMSDGAVTECTSCDGTGSGRDQAVNYYWWAVRENDRGSRFHRECPTSEDIRRELAGKDLVCWCPLDEPCHADILLEIAAGKPGDSSNGGVP